MTDAIAATHAELRAADRRIAELEHRLKETAHAYDVTFKRRVDLEAMLIELLEYLDEEIGVGSVDHNWPALRELAKT